MPENFVKSFAHRLDKLTPLKVVVGKHNDELKPGCIYIAPGNKNMIVRRNMKKKVVVDFSKVKYPEYNDPSINALMLSVSKVYKERAIGVILTGMGKDGALGLTEMYKSGGYSIAQDKASSIVYGMPKEVAEREVIHKAVGINEMAGFIVSCLA